MKKPIISDFSDSYDSIGFSNVLKPIIDKLPNPNYYLDVINKRFEFRINELENNLTLLDRASLLREYLVDLRKFSVDAVKLYEIVNSKINQKNPNKFNIQILKVKNSFNVIKNYTAPIQKNVEIDEIDLAIRIKNYLIVHLKEVLSILDSEFSIYLKKSPLNIELKKVFKELDKSINIKELQLLGASKRTKFNKSSNEKHYKWYPLIPFLVDGTINEIQFNSPDFEATKLSQVIVENCKLTKVDCEEIRPYIQDTLFSPPSKGGAKNLFSEKKLKEIIKYCREKNLPIKDELIMKKIHDFGIDI